MLIENTTNMLIGKTITITDATNKSLEGKRGLVTDETKQTIVIQEAYKVPRDKLPGTITIEQPDTKTITIIKTQLITYTIERNNHGNHQEGEDTC